MLGQILLLHKDSIAIFELVLFILKQVMSEGKSYYDKRMCSKTVAKILVAFKGFGDRDLDHINEMLDKLMIIWQCDQLSELSEAIFYESKLF